MEQVHKDRLLQLADFLETLPPEAFNYGEWVCQEECGTVACALGWAPKLFPSIVSWNSSFNVPGTTHSWAPFAFHGEYLNPYDAAKSVFDCSPAQAEFLFFPDSFGNGLSVEVTAGDVAAHIRRFVNELDCCVPSDDEDDYEDEE